MPETAEELHARAAGALRMPPVEDWVSFPFDGKLRPRALQPPVESEPLRFGQGGPEDLWRANLAAVAEALAQG